MKTLITAMALCATAALLPLQAQDTVTSVNAVGMVRVTVNPGEFTLFSLPFDIDPNASTAMDLIGPVPFGTILYYWDNNSWVSEIYTEGSALFDTEDEWSTEFGRDSRQFQRGEGIFVFLPAGNDPIDIVLSGQVPDSNSAPVTNIQLGEGFNLIGFAYPVEINISDARLGFTPSFGDSIFVWHNGWQASFYQEGSPLFDTEDGWDVDFTIMPAGAMFYRTNNANSIEIIKDLLYSFP